MLRWLPAPLKGLLNALAVMIHTVFWCIPLFTLLLFKLVIPTPSFQRLCYKGMNFLGNGWVSTNNLLMALTLDIQWTLPTLTNLSVNDWYFIIANHQSWSYILILQKVFLHKTPFIRFFIKKQLLWLPVINIAWYAYDFPIMHRFSKETLQAHPEWRGKDVEATRRACEKFKLIPVSVLNFLEGTRFTPSKHKHQHSPYRHLLVPKCGGFAFAINALDKRITHVLDVTIAYPQGRQSFWNFICGKVHQVTVEVVQREIPNALLSGNYSDDEHYRHEFKEWVNGIWKEKDERLDSLLKLS